jgi:hypothetical protein
LIPAARRRQLSSGPLAGGNKHMRRTHLLLLLLTFTPTFKAFGQAATYDFFPLAIGNRWTYNYSASDWEQLGDFTLSDSGTAVYTVASKYSANDSTIWGIKEVRSVLHRVSYYFDHGRDTSYAINDSTSFGLVEHLSDNHMLSSNASSWQSVFFLNSRFTDSTQFHRFFPTASQDTFTLVYKKYHQTLLIEVISVSYQRSTGLNKISYSAPGIVGVVLKSNHALMSAVLTNVNNSEPWLIPEDFALEKNFPNPFNPTSTISFHISKHARVTVRIYDILGRLLITLLDGNIPSGFHSLIWDASAQSSGTYICVAQANGLSRAINLTLIK